jgi:CIC family chloride channel protein
MHGAIMDARHRVRGGPPLDTRGKEDTVQTAIGMDHEAPDQGRNDHPVHPTGGLPDRRIPVRSLGSLARLLNRWQPPESVVISGTAIAMGLGTGAGVWLFKRLVDGAHIVMFNWLGDALARFGGWTLLLVPIIGGLFVGLVVQHLIGHERHHGVAGVMEAVALGGGRIRYARMPVKAFTSALSIGAGASVGPEDPSVQIGASLGSMLGQWLHLSEDRIRALVAAGAGAGIAAAFNAPIAGVFFALEIILGELTGSAVGVVALATVLSSVVTQALAGAQPAFKVPAYAFNSAWELLLYLGLGLLAGPIGAVYTRSIYLAQDTFARWHIPPWLKTGAAGAVLGVAALTLPQVLGVGYDTIGILLSNQPLAVSFLVGLLVLKLVLTALSIGGGFYGGVFAPSLFLGAALGAVYGQLGRSLLPSLGLDPAAFAMVGMAALLAAAVHAPLTAVILLFEMTDDYRIILPLMFAVTVSLVISRQLERESVYTLSLVRKGIHLHMGRDTELLETITVGEIMQTDPPTVREDDSLAKAYQVMEDTRQHGIPVVDADGRLVGLVALDDLDRTHTENGGPGRTVGEVCTRELLVAYPDESIADALRRMGPRDVGRLPVVARDDPERLLGLLRSSHVVRAYNIALTRRAALRHRAHQARLGAFGGVNVEEVTIQPGAPCVGHRVRELAWPRDSVLASLRRGRHTLIPHGDTALAAGDVLVAVAEGEAIQQIRQICEAAPETAGQGSPTSTHQEADHRP